MARVEADQDECVGSGHCVFAAPEVFALGEDGTVEVLDADPQGEQQDAAAAAIRGCPASAIRFAGA
ncbi:MAG: ferredoxin [Actinomycetota bacterium]|nr:ferredoxin [Actinomycetota bacterium]